MNPGMKEGNLAKATEADKADKLLFLPDTMHFLYNILHQHRLCIYMLFLLLIWHIHAHTFKCAIVYA